MNFKNKIFYHGSNNKFTTFDKSKIRENKLGLCFNFTDDYSMAYQYGDNILKVHLDLNNPITSETMKSKWTYEQDEMLAKKLGFPPQDKEDFDENETFGEVYEIFKMKPEFIELLEEMGYDGIAYPEDHHYGVFEPEQIHIIQNEELDVKLPFDPNKKTWYHGTTEYFDKFDLQYFGKTDVGFLGKGVYLAGNYSSAQSYSYPYKLDYIPKEAHVYACKVNIKNPYIILNDERYSVYEYQLRMDLDVNSNRDITPELQKRGYDSVLKCNKFELGYDVELCVFNPEQVTIIDEIPDKGDKRDIYYNKSLTERFEEIERNVFATDSGYDIINRMKNKPQAYRIIYDGNIGYYFIGDAFDYIHQDMLEHAYYQGFYPSMLSANDVDDYMNQGMEEQSVILFAFDPDGGGMLDAEKSSDGYTRKYVYDFGTIYAHEFTPFENCPLYKLLGEPIKKENVFEDFKTLNEILERYILNEEAAAARIGNEIEVRNDGDDEKFAHFHWLGNYDIHFMFAKQCPQNVEQLKKLISKIDKNKTISNKELSRVLKVIRAKVNKGPFKGKTVFEASMLRWQQLNPNTPIQFVEI